ncbi:hypothetical protein [Gemmata massiliana]|uniref:hypothetical protein n=1 Tax=Gemmata massiliana TaxID=1210884 RepID=UPI0013A6CC77|nr:hypothetical protein [Gemmata massiliana]
MSTMYPADHDVAAARVSRVIDIISNQPSITNEQVAIQLIIEGINRVDAVLLVLLVPSGLSYPILRQWGVTHFPDNYQVLSESGRMLSMPLAAERYFTVALNWAEEILKLDPSQRPVSQQAFEAVTNRSAEIGCAIQLLEKGGPNALQGATFGPMTVSGVTAEEILAHRRDNTLRRAWWQFW